MYMPHPRDPEEVSLPFPDGEKNTSTQQQTNLSTVGLGMTLALPGFCTVGHKRPWVEADPKPLKDFQKHLLGILGPHVVLG